MGVFTRGKTLWVRYRDAEGNWRNASTGYVVGQEKLAEATYDELTSRIQSATAKGETTVGPLTVRKFGTDWIAERQQLDLDWSNDESRLRHHVYPVIGEMKIADVRTRHIIDLFHRIRTNKERPVAQRTVYSIYSVVSALFRDAKLADKIEQSPCCLDDRHLGPFIDKNPEWRATAIFSRDEVETLISHPGIPFDRRIVYAIELLAGVRTGEAAALRWRHYDPTKQPLGELLVAFAYSTLKSREKTTKTDTSKHIPVHPTLAAMLAEWKLGGWAAMMGRHPEPNDLIVPVPPEHVARRRLRPRTGDAFRGYDYSGERWRRDDLPTLGWRHRRHYDMRATFITLALEDGADRHLLEERVTHTKKRRSAFDGYNRGLQWERTCAEVAKLKISRRTTGQGAVIALPVAAGAETAETADDDASRYSARYSSRKDEGSHAKNLPDARRARATGPPRRSEWVRSVVRAPTVVGRAGTTSLRSKVDSRASEPRSAPSAMAAARPPSPWRRPSQTNRLD